MGTPSKAVKAALRAYMLVLAAKGGRKGGKARTAALSATERRDLARKAAQARWGKAKKK